MALSVVGCQVAVVRADNVTVSLDADARYQTMLGWSGMAWYQGIAPEVRDQVLDDAIQELGLTRLHWTVPSGNRSDVRGWEWINDDGDSLHINWMEP